jgi:uncharacterized phage-associated protein
MGHILKFQFNEKKGVEALTYIASKWPGITAFFASKVIFFAEKRHINSYGRPIVADTFIAMTNGPVPETLYHFIKGWLAEAGDPEAINSALHIRQQPYPSIEAKRAADKSVLSLSDIECIDAALKFCRGKSFQDLSLITHQDRAWAEAPVNQPMDYAKMIDDSNPNREMILSDMEEFALYGVL